ncbi:hypothetical protein OIV83_001584 [Microbotryomycetes sp. JL201]|nr:hypothetical protein OIV83_001584 [Microbotryomycetes sp. JL201]
MTDHDDPRLLDEARIGALRDQIYGADLDQATSGARQNEHWHKIERERFQAEKDQLMMQAYALAHKLKLAQRNSTAAHVTRRVDEYGHATEYGGHVDSRHAADLRNAQRRLRDAEAQVARLQAELKKLRPLYLHGSPLVAYDAEVQIPKSDDNRPRKAPTLGDAEAEHMLLAGQTLSHVRRINRVPLTSAIVQQAEDIIAKGHLAEAAGGQDEVEDMTTTPRRKSRHRKQTDNNANGDSPGVNDVQSPSKPAIVVTPSRRGADGSAPTPRPLEHPTPGRLDDLLQAAQTVETGSSPHTQQAEPSTVKRRRLNTGEASPTRHRHSPWRPSTARALQQLQMDDVRDDDMDTDAREHTMVGGVGSGGDTLTALDVLAQASASQHATSSQTPPNDDGDDDYVEPNSGFAKPAPRGLSSAATLNPPEHSLLRGQSTEPKVRGNSGFGSPLAPGIDINSLGNGGTPKPLRSPYIKWNINEDEQLLNAVLKHGLRWDQVSAEIPTRSYHQVRQRFLRGLKNGKNLPAELSHYGDRIRETVKAHEDKKRTKKDKLGNGGTPGTPGLEMLDDDEYLQE